MAGARWARFATVFIQRLNFCDFAFILERSEFDGKIGIQSLFEPSLRNLPVRLSTPVALLVLNSFNIFRINTELTFSNFSFFRES